MEVSWLDSLRVDFCRRIVRVGQKVTLLPEQWLKSNLNDGTKSPGQEEAGNLAKNGGIQGLEVFLKSKNK